MSETLNFEALNFEDSIVSQEEAEEAIDMLNDHFDETFKSARRFKPLLMTAMLSVEKRLSDLSDRMTAVEEKLRRIERDVKVLNEPKDKKTEVKTDRAEK